MRHPTGSIFTDMKKAPHLCPFCDERVPQNMKKTAKVLNRAMCKDPECIKLMFRLCQQRRRAKLYAAGLNARGQPR